MTDQNKHFVLCTGHFYAADSYNHANNNKMEIIFRFHGKYYSENVSPCKIVLALSRYSSIMYFE
jgi:hypothetical protein